MAAVVLFGLCLTSTSTIRTTTALTPPSTSSSSARISTLKTTTFAPTTTTHLKFGYLDSLGDTATVERTTAEEGTSTPAPPSSGSGMSYLDSLTTADAVDIFPETPSKPAVPVPPPAAAAVAAVSSTPVPQAPPPPPQQQYQPPPPPPPQQQQQQLTKEQQDSSNTLSATSPTISLTLPVGLAPPKLTKPKQIGYGESSRKFRRTVYTHADWERHRSPDRFIRNLASITSSGVYKNIAKEVFVATGITALVMLYNSAVCGYSDLDGVFHDPIWNSQWLPPLTLPLQPFTLCSPSLGLLLAFRTNTAYQRWDEARKNWGMNINHTRDLVRMGNAYYDRTGVSEEQRQKDLDHLSLCTWAFVRSMKRHLSPESEDEANFKAELYERMPKAQAEKIIKAAHRPNRALYDLSMAIENLPMHFMRKNEMHAALTIFEDNLGSSERLLTSPVPLIYNRHTARFLTIWLFILPVALWEPFGFMWNHIGMLPAMSVISLLLFGTEELAVQMEEPFTILPMQAFCDKIGNWCNEIVGWEDGDNGQRTRPSFQGHSTVFLSGGQKQR
eukprot:CAMPEP_0113497370 /NCGR_PEP_ID=MMETSP0014_2-20120614/30599_1 /TAXON_ID=2857 /ORGANISM="Nitzschia sp." /LENGTH=556 /DNA_ID=CAMNT_0000391315 /DNA_START=131 /DNA_END=1801 /DNA_ORIENTATION=+ /assembly_acc=CAM_ASM_000159